MKTRFLSTARLSLPLATALAALLASPCAHAGTIDWDGDTSTGWATGGNWAGGTAPVDDLTTDIANFNLATYGGDPVFAPDAGTRSINGITIGATNGAMTLTTTSLSVGGSGISIADGAGALTINGGLTLGAAQNWIKNSTNGFTVSASVDNGGFLLTVDGAGTTSISGNISGAGGLTKQSAVSLTLSGTNTYSGATTISAGRLILNSTGALSPNTAVTVASGAQLYFQPGAENQTYANAMTISGVGIVEGDNTKIGAIRLGSGVTLSGTLTLPADARVGSVGTVSATISGQVTGSGGLEFHGVKNANTNTTFTLSNTGNNYAGTTTISSKNFTTTNRTGTNTLKLGAAGVIPDGVGKGIVAFTGTSASHTNILDLNGFDETVNGLSNTGDAVARITNTVAGTAVLTVGAADTTSSFSGTITEAGSGAILALSKTGTGTLTLGGANSYTGTTTVNAGTLNLTGNRTAAAGSITVQTGGTLGISNGNFSLGTTDNFTVGTVSGTSTVNHTAGTISTGTGGNQVLLGSGNAAAAFAGIYNLSGGQLNIGYTGTADRGVLLASGANSTATFNLSGTGHLNMTGASSRLVLGLASNGTTSLFNQTGGTATIKSLRIGGSSGTGINATLSITGGVFTAATFDRLASADTNTALIHIGGSADVTLPAFPTTALGAGSTATITFDGGVLKNLAASTDYLGSISTAQIKDGGATINTAAGDITITQALENFSGHTGGLTKAGANTLTLAGANSYTGATLISGGTLSVESIAAMGGAQPLGEGSTPIQLQGGTLAITGTAPSGYTTNRGLQLVSPNNESGTLSVAGTVNMSGGITGGSSAATFNKSGAGTFNYSGPASWNGDFYITGGTFNLTGGTIAGVGVTTLSNSGTSLRISAAGAMKTASLDIASGTTVNLEAGTLRVGGGGLGVSDRSITNEGAFNWGNGTLAVYTTGSGEAGLTDRTSSGGDSSGPVVREGNYLSVQGSLTNSAGSTLDLGSTYLSNGLRYNQLNVNGTLTLNGGTLNIGLNPYFLRPSSPNSVVSGDWGTLILVYAGDITGAFAASGGMTTIPGISSDAIGWTQLADGSITNPATMPLNTWVIEYRDGTGGFTQAGGDVILLHYKVAGSVPEPGAAGLMIAGGMLLRALRRRRL